MHRVLFAAICALVLASGAQAQQTDGVNCRKGICTVRDSPGGYVDAFEALARKIRKRGYQLRIDGPCASACVMLADMARKQTCITPRASFGFHKGIIETIDLQTGQVVETREFTLHHSASIQKWVRRNGGFPSNRSGRMLWMKYAVAKKFWKTC